MPPARAWTGRRASTQRPSQTAPATARPLVLAGVRRRARFRRSARPRARTGMDDSKKALTFNACADSTILSRAEPSRAEPSRAEPSRAEPSRAEPSRAEPSRAEPSRAEPSVGYCLSSTSPSECSAAPVSARPSDAPSPSGRARRTRSAAPAGARDRDRSRRHGIRHHPRTRGTPRGTLGRPEARSNVERRSTMTRRAGWTARLITTLAVILALTAGASAQDNTPPGPASAPVHDVPASSPVYRRSSRSDLVAGPSLRSRSRSGAARRAPRGRFVSAPRIA